MSNGVWRGDLPAAVFGVGSSHRNGSTSYQEATTARGYRVGRVEKTEGGKVTVYFYATGEIEVLDKKDVTLRWR